MGPCDAGPDPTVEFSGSSVCDDAGMIDATPKPPARRHRHRHDDDAAVVQPGVFEHCPQGSPE
ncbi:MAG: hypothetical protein ACK462_02990, partial [Planctomyces sp.]